MAEYSRLITTNLGKALVAKTLAGGSKTDFTKVSSSSTQYQMKDLESLTELTNIQQSSLISNKEITNQVAVKVRASFTNTTLTTGYYMRTLGLYAVDPDLGEILFAVTIENSGNCYIPPYNGVTVSAVIVNLITTVGNADNVSLEVDPAAVATVQDVKTLQNTITVLNGQLVDLQSYVGYSDEKIFGVDVDFKNKTFVRLGGAVGRTGGKDFDDVNAFGKRKRCNLTDDGVVTAYLGDEAYTETGALTQAVTINGTIHPIGTKVQVMVEQPKFYYKVTPIKLENYTIGLKSGKHLRRAKYYVSDTPREGFKVHPMFIENGHENNFIYESAYEGCLFDTSASTYILNDAQVYVAGDKLSSIAGANPVSGLTQNLTRAVTRSLAAARGTGWGQEYTATAFGTIMLMLIEYASFNMQECIGRGNVDKTDDSSTSMTEVTGATAGFGNASGSVKNDNNINIVSYRGKENPWGNIWTWLDGMNLNNATSSGTPGTIYIADHSFADDIGTGAYIDSGITPVQYTSTTYGYISAFGYDKVFDWCFIASEILGNSVLPVSDYFWNHGGTGWRVARLGATWSHVSQAGAVALYLYDASSARARIVGGRLVYIPSKKKYAA